MQEHKDNLKCSRSTPEKSEPELIKEVGFTRGVLEKAERAMGQDAFNLFNLAYKCYFDKTRKLPPPPKQRINISKLTVISFEGINCSGKTTQANRIVKIFEKQGAILPPRFYDCPPAKIIQAKSRGLFYQMFNPIIDSLLIASAYVDKFDKLNKNKYPFIVSDRSIDSLYVFQGRKLAEIGYSIEESVSWLMRLVKNVDCDKFKFYLDVSLREAQRRNFVTRKAIFSREERKELLNVLKMYKLLKEKFKRNYVVINANLPVDEVTDLIVKEIKI